MIVEGQGSDESRRFLVMVTRIERVTPRLLSPLLYQLGYTAM